MSTNNLFGNLTGPAKTEPSEEDLEKQIAAQPDEVTPSAEDVTEESNSLGSDEGEDDLEMPSELDMLKQRAKLMGISFSNNIGIDALKARIADKLADKQDEEKEEMQPEAKEIVKSATPAKKPASLRKVLYEENMRLVRIRITNMDPKDANLPGGIFTVANEFLGTVSKYVPFGEATENGYHVPYCIYKFLRSQKFLQIRVTKKNGKEDIQTQWVRKFAIEMLPPLTDKELATLQASQLASGATND
ncbi:putative structural protein [Agrobacterium phage OLIVR2]|uniref:Putative structural protein n=1 Tax=Agrobacterium phage OLIVR1 TaxID=2723769 RepID=A0A858MR82_9CAUD|nr:hypothetical protein [Xanthomonas campestris]YP_010107125.1 putative structural protein [Agrobacterium phage OLIVR1]QIW87393.1 putative structural protein [Agrobacterium phage OLIVR2]QIW87500.1 putative structural protein [Agrobacterium phage OLIVR3]MCF8861591.1 hypothetical protein [Xanthomonas campestris pv. campestris]QIW87286.1 putative structural protein [Agrobacterium phage OLIVR1]